MHSGGGVRYDRDLLASSGEVESSSPSIDLITWESMTMFRKIGIAFGVTFLILAASYSYSTFAADPVDEKSKLDASYREMLDVWLRSRIETLGIPGIAIAVVHDQDVIYQGCFGYANVAAQKRITPKTQFRIASQSKVFTALAIMQLRDEGKLRLDDSLSEHLDWAHVKNSDNKEADVTIRQLLTHTSGLSSIALHSRPLWSNFEFPTVEELHAEMDGQVLLFPPGEQLKYSNLGVTLLGQVIESASGQSFSDYVEEHLLSPLELDSTVVAIDPSASELATGYAPRRKGAYEALPFVDAKAMAPAMGMSASVEDLAKFVSWQFRQLSSDQVDVLSGATLREMQRAHRISSDWSFGQGFVFWVMKQADRTIVGHDGQNPGFYSCSYISPEERIGVVVLANGMEMEVYPGKTNSLVDAIFATVADAFADDRPAKVPDPKWSEYYGEYESIWGRIQVMPVRGELTAFYLDDALPTSRLYRLKAVEPGVNVFRAVHSDDSFYLKEEFSFRDFDQGRAMTLRDPGADFRRVNRP